MKIILVSGIPASGKTSIANRISKELNIQLHTKDQEKVKLFNSESKSTLLRWQWYENRANEMMFKQLEAAVKQNKDIILESNFLPYKDRKIIKIISGDNDLREVYCTAKGLVIIKRFILRNESKVRTKHKSNHDRLWYPLMVLFGILKCFHKDFPHSKLAINSKVMTVDTTNFDEINFDKVYEFVE